MCCSPRRCVPLSYLVSRAALGDKAVALSTTALLTLLPELMIDVARVSNESLALLCFTLVLLFALQAAAEPQRWMWWLLLGAALGCGLLTKAYFLSAIPALAIVALYCVWSNGFPGVYSPGRRALAARICAAFIVVFAIAGRRYLRVHAETGSWSGQGDDVALRGVSLAQKLAGVPHVNWKSGVVSVLLSHTWFGGWSFLRLPLVLYFASLAAIILAVAGVVTRLVRRQSQNPTRAARDFDTGQLLCLLLGRSGLPRTDNVSQSGGLGIGGLVSLQPGCGRGRAAGVGAASVPARGRCAYWIGCWRSPGRLVWHAIPAVAILHRADGSCGQDSGARAVADAVQSAAGVRAACRGTNRSGSARRC